MERQRNIHKNLLIATFQNIRLLWIVVFQKKLVSDKDFENEKKKKKKKKKKKWLKKNKQTKKKKWKKENKEKDKEGEKFQQNI